MRREQLIPNTVKSVGQTTVELLIGGAEKRSGYTVTISRLDYERVANLHWHVQRMRGVLCVRASVVREGRRTSIGMGNFILAKRGHVTHKNEDPLDFRRENISAKSSLRSTKYKGVFRRRNKYEASIQMGGQPRYIGLFDTAEQAAVAYDKVADQLGRETNFEVSYVQEATTEGADGRTCASSA